MKSNLSNLSVKTGVASTSEKIQLSLLFPSFILGLCFLEQSFGNLLELRVVWFFYAYLLYSLFLRISQTRLAVNINSLFSYLLWVGAYLIAVLLSRDSFQLVYGELFNILWWTIFSILLASELNTYHKLEIFIKFLAKFVFFGTLITSSIGLLKMYSYENLGIAWKTSYSIDGTLIQGSSLNTDYNIYSLGIMYGALAGKYLSDNYPTKGNKILSHGSLIILLISMVTSGSRRGLLLSLALIVIFVFVNLSITTSVKQVFLRKKINFLLAIGMFVVLLAGSFDLIENIMSKFQFGNTIFDRLLTTKSQITTANDRNLRWDYSWELLSRKNFISFNFGSGFDYIKAFAKRFNVFGEDHPHNFIIATFLYGGIFSLVLLIVNLVPSLKILVRHGIFKLFFLYFFFLILFALTSSNTLFSYRFFFVLLLLPRLIRMKTV